MEVDLAINTMGELCTYLLNTEELHAVALLPVTLFLGIVLFFQQYRALVATRAPGYTRRTRPSRRSC